MSAQPSPSRSERGIRVTGAISGALIVALVGMLFAPTPAAAWVVLILAGTVGTLLLARAELSAIDRRLSARLLFEKRDAWLGVYWTTARADALNDGRAWHVLHVYVCVIPFVPILVTYSRKALSS